MLEQLKSLDFHPCVSASVFSPPASPTVASFAPVVLHIHASGALTKFNAPPPPAPPPPRPCPCRKLVSDFAVRTRTGAFISIAAIVVALILFVSELRLYLTLESVEHMEVDDAAAGGFRGGAAVLNKMLRINFDVTFPGIACALLSLDAADASGQHNENVIHNVFKRRLATDGTPIGVGEKEDSLRVLKTTEELQREKNKAISEGRPSAPKVDGLCGDCYGAAAEGVCCNTCEDVREVYKKKGWQFSMKGVSQCEKEGFYGDVAGQMSQVRSVLCALPIFTNAPPGPLTPPPPPPPSHPPE